MSSPNQTRAHFGLFEFDLQTGELKKENRPVKLQAQPAKVLVMLVNRAGEMVSRREIQEHVWGDNYVEFDQGLNYCIRQIRAALGDRAESPSFIETIPRQGYRFIAPVGKTISSIDKDDREQIGRQAYFRGRSFYLTLALAAILILGIALVYKFKFTPTAGIPGERVKLAVLPFANINLNSEVEYFSDGLTEELITHISRLNPDQLGVIARTSAMRYKGVNKTANQIGLELGADYLLEGSVRSVNGQLRVTTQLIRASDQSHLWAQSYDRPLEDVLAIQREVAQLVARSLALKLMPNQAAEKTDRPHPAAREAYLKGNYHLNKRTPESIKASLSLFEQAIELDPNYAPAYLGLAQARLRLNREPMEALPKVKEAVQKALDLDHTLAEAHLLMAQIHLLMEWNWNLAKEEFEHTIELDPGRAMAYHGYAFYFLTLRQFDQAIAQLEKALELDPVSPVVHGDLGWIYHAAGRHDEAIRYALRTLELEPDQINAHNLLFQSFLHQEKIAEAIQQARILMKLQGADSKVIATLDSSDPDAGLQAYRRWHLELLRERARNHYVDATLIALAYADLGDKERAIEALQDAYRQHSVGLAFLRVDSRFDLLRSDYRFTELIRLVGLQS